MQGNVVICNLHMRDSYKSVLSIKGVLDYIGIPHVMETQY